MLEGVVTWVLKYYLGEYVDNLSTEHLSFGLLQGQVELENLPLKKDALRSLNLPLEVKSGFVGRIHLSVPIKQLRSRPWVITLEKLYLVAGPADKQEYNEAEERESEQQRKQTQLQALEEKWKAQKEMAPQDQSYSWWSYGTSFITNIVENLQLQVKDVHIRYEDEQTIPGCAFACGVVIDNLSVESTDGSWLPKFVSRYDTDMMHKLVDLKDFSIYWDINAKMVGGLSHAELEAALLGQRKNSPTTSPDGEMASAEDRPADNFKLPIHEFILEPVSAQARMKRNTSALPLRSPDKPRITMDITLDKIPFDLSEAQFRGMVAWMKEFDRHDKGRMYRRWRPMCKLKGNAGEWWHYAIESHLHYIRERNRRRRQEYVIKRCGDNVLYVQAYVSCLTKGEKYMDSKLKTHIQWAEEEWTFEELKLLREIAMNQVMEDERQAAAAKEMIRKEEEVARIAAGADPAGSQGAQSGGLWQWIPGLRGWYGYGATSASPTSPKSPGHSPEEPGTPDILPGPRGGTPPTPSGPTPLQAAEGEPPAKVAKADTELDKEVMDMLADSAENNTLLKRDVVFAQLNFTLQQGVFRLLADTDCKQDVVKAKTLLELECTAVKMLLESRPRTRGMKFGISVGGLYLRDKMTPDSLLSVLVAPQQRANVERSPAQGRHLLSGVLGMAARTGGYLQATSMRGSQTSQPDSDSAQTTLFSLTFEKRPAQSKADYRLEIKTKPLDIIYNPTTIRRVKDFFTVRKKGMSAIKTELEIAAAAKSRYEALKQQTQTELRQTLDQILEGDEKIKAKRWEFDLDISAPQIIIPDSFSDQNATMVVCDLGRLQFYNTQGSIQERLQRQGSEDSEDFVTPSSTPPNEQDAVETESVATDTTTTSGDPLSDIFSGDLSEAALREKIYDKYTLNLNDLQVMVGKAKDNWRFAHNKGTSHIHVVDKFSISLQFDRRLLYTSDPQWPKATLSGTLPSLTLHVNEQKIQALQKCVSLVSDASPTSPDREQLTVPAPRKPGPPEGLDKSMYYSMYQAASKSVISLPEATLADQQTRQAIAESRLILSQFSIMHVSLEVQSRGRSIAELQVAGVSANFTKRPYDTSVSFSIHSLLVVDAVQTFGQDFELLVASHKNLCLDSKSGSMLDSDPNSPVSPCSPLSPSSPAEPIARPAGPPSGLASLGQTVSNALQSLVTSTQSVAGGPSVLTDSPPTISPFSSLNLSKSPTDRPSFLPVAMDTEALIKMEVDIISPHCPTNGNGDETLHIANLQFNNLDFIANQQTIMELLSFFQGVFPNESSTKKPDFMKPKEKTMDPSSATEVSGGRRWEVTADFHRLNVLLMRVADKEFGEKIGKKVATATLTEAKIQATLAEELEVEGSLGGLQLLDLTPEGSKHQKIFSVGLDVSGRGSTSQSHDFSHVRHDMYRTAQESLLLSSDMDRAFTFSYNTPSAAPEKMENIPGILGNAPGLIGTSTGILGHSPKASGHSVGFPVNLMGQSPVLLGHPVEPTDHCYKPPAPSISRCPNFLDPEEDPPVQLTVRMASLCYVHAPRFLKEVSQCVEEFRGYMADVSDTIKHAATEVAMKMVKHEQGVPLYGSTLSLDVTPGAKRRRHQSVPDSDADAMDVSDTETLEDSPRKLLLDFVLQTPVIMLPRTPNSSEVLVAHLGRISLRNSQAEGAAYDDLSANHRDQDKMYMEIRDMSMYSVDLDKQKSLQQEVSRGHRTMAASVFSTPQPGGYVKTSYGTPILHDTVIELVIQQHSPLDDSFINQDMMDYAVGNEFVKRKRKFTDDGEGEENTIYVSGKVVTPLKLVLNKPVYEQILQTVDNITPDDDVLTEGATENVTLVDIVEDESTLQESKSVSALTLDELDLSRSLPRSISRSISRSSGRESHDARDQVKSDKPLVIKGRFEMPTFSARLCSDIADSPDNDRAFINLHLQDFKVNFEKCDQWTKNIELFLQTLVMEDLLQPEGSGHRLIMESHGAQNWREGGEGEERPYLSSSCPTSMLDIPLPDMPPSLPTSLNNLKENVFSAKGRPTPSPAKPTPRQRIKSMSACEYPCTPPPSPQVGSPQRSRSPSGSCDYLVHINVKLVDKKCPEFNSKYNSTNRHVDVDFNSLDTTINLQTWVVLLDFLGMGAKIHDLDQFTAKARRASRIPSTEPNTTGKDYVNTEVDLKIHSFNLIFNKPEYELAKANISQFTSHVSLRDGHFAIKGELGSMSLQDTSPHGKMYRERFITTGSQALNFDMFKYGTPDPDLVRENDISLKLRMSSVFYVHTHRFMQEILAFLQHFMQLQDMIGRKRATSAGQNMSNIELYRGARISLDIEAGAPKLLIPHSSRTTDILVVNMGTLTICNSFMVATSEGTIAAQREARSRSVDTENERRGRSDTTDTELSDLLSMESAGIDLQASTPNGDAGSSSHFMSDLMTSSIYGSLEKDLRSDDYESMTNSTYHSLSRSEGERERSASLSGFYSALGSEQPSVSSIGVDKKPPGGHSLNNSEPSGRKVEQFLSSMPSTEHKCLLDAMHIELVDMDVYSAEYKKREDCSPQRDDLQFPSFIVQREAGQMMREKCRLTLQVERNLEGDISRSSPDLSIDGKLSSLFFQLDLKQYKLVKGLLQHNFGENLEYFPRPDFSSLQDNLYHSEQSEVYKGISITLDLDGVITELLVAHSQGSPLSASQGSDTTELSLARFDFIQSRLSFEIYSDGCKDIDLVSHQIIARDTRYKDAPKNVRPNMFSEILKPSAARSTPEALQMELHWRSTKEFTRFTILLNNMRLMGVFDWLLAVVDFLLTGVEDPFKKDVPEDIAESSQASTPRTASPVTVSGGIVTKRPSPHQPKQEAPFELRLNVTDTELVVVEDTRDRDTNAVILKSTAVLIYKPQFSEKPVSCSLQSLEVFSCSLAGEEETALSIIDPMSITLELNGSPASQQRKLGPSGLLDATSQRDKPPILETSEYFTNSFQNESLPFIEITFSTLNIRLSYNDLKLFLAIVNSMPQQLIQATKQTPPKNAAAQSKYSEESISKLEELGFSRQEAERALQHSKGRLDNAALWLTHNAIPIQKSNAKPKKKNEVLISGFEVKAASVCFCVIDDCLDADVPLAEMSMTSFHFLHKIHPHGQGNASFKLTGEYYNRALSGWEPFLETWGCQIGWQQGLPGEENKLSVDIRATDTLNLNVTKALLEVYNNTKQKWTQDYYKPDSESSVTTNRKRQPFTPFAINNQTGCVLQWCSVTTNPTRMSPSSESSMESLGRQWKSIKPGDECPFYMEEREKIRHKSTHELKTHQLVVRVAGWQEVSPVSMDKVGVYFREAKPVPDMSSNIYYEVPPARIVFDVTIEGSARKVVTVRSALMVHNRLKENVEICLNSMMPNPEGSNKVVSVPAGTRKAMPLIHVHSKLLVKPLGWSLDWCNRAIQWDGITKGGENKDYQRTCDTVGGDKETYRFCVSVYRQHFPMDPQASRRTGSPQEAPMHSQPGHIITLMPPLRVENLLPMEMTYCMKVSGTIDVKNSIKPGDLASIIMADLSQALVLSIGLENFPQCKDLVIPPGTLDYKVKLKLYDNQDRLLELYVRIKAGLGGSVKLSISAPYWLVNKSGLPLIFRQDGCAAASGQFDEHELARSVTPLLFSYVEKEKSFLCSMRLGKSVHGAHQAKPQWCHRFSLERGMGVRPIHVTPITQQRPDWVYNIGIEVRQGRGKYSDTNIVTFSPRYQLDNRSSRKLAFAQRHFANRWAMSPQDYLSALPQCTLSFHWPRVDLDTLLCVRLLDDTHCQWSGGFKIDRVQSFHINMRSEQNRCEFLRVDIVLQGATFFVVFTDASHMPPPYRIDNFAEVPIQYYQTRIQDEKLRTFIKPRTSVPYAWDEPILPPHITLHVQGGSSATYDMNVIADGEQLCYENFIYIAFAGTFKSFGARHGNHGNWSGYGSYLNEQRLVLDVIGPNRVVLKKQELGKRSQLWRMTSIGMLQHEGSSVPRDPRKPTSSSEAFVLDISDIALQPDRDVLLTLKKPDERRRYSQTWRFTEDGRLCCGSSSHLCIQAKDGVFGLRDGGEAVLGPAPPNLHAPSPAPSLYPAPSQRASGSRERRDIPVEMAVSRMKMQPGSGFLSVKVLTDGPTRVLQITDIRQQQYKDEDSEDWCVVSEKRAKPLISGQKEEEKLEDKEEEEKKSISWELSLHLPAGIGVSLVSSQSEELIYMLLRDIILDYSSSPGGQILIASVKSLQVDNQIFGTFQPVLLFVTPNSHKDTESDRKPALQISAHKVPSGKWNADIYKYMMVAIKKLTILVEEVVLWKLLEFVGYNQSNGEIENLDENSFDSQRVLTAATSTRFKRYYFGTLKISTSRVALSMFTANELPRSLKVIKRVMAIPLIRFEEAKVELDPYVQLHPFETKAFLLESLKLHYTEELKSQAAKILGSVDFLGNPLGLFNDVAEGVSGLLEGNVSGLLKNVTHGVSDSTAKVVGSLSDGVGIVTLDDRHQRVRQQIREHTGSGTDHLLAGVKGLGHGFLGGLTSIVSQTYGGAKKDGVEGVFTGFAKGVVGTVTKPVAGVLDFASGAASAVRDTSKGSARMQPGRSRLPRCGYGPGGVLPQYSDHHAEAQAFMYQCNENNFKEKFIAWERVQFGKNSVYALITNEKVYFLPGKEHSQKDALMCCTYDNLITAKVTNLDNNSHYIELTIRTQPRGISVQEPTSRPKVRCDSEAIALKVCQQILYAKNLFEEQQHTLPPDVRADE